MMKSLASIVSSANLPLGLRNSTRNSFISPKLNGEADGDKELPLSATYIIDEKGVIRWALVNADYRQRAEPADIAASLEKLKTEKN